MLAVAKQSINISSCWEETLLAEEDVEEKLNQRNLQGKVYSLCDCGDSFMGVY